MRKYFDRKSKKSIKINYLMNTVLTLSSMLFPLITFPYVSRILGPEGTGKVSFATSLVSYFVMIAQLGIPTYGIRAVAQNRDDLAELKQIVKELFIISLIMTVIAYIGLLVTYLCLPKLHEEKVLYLVVGSGILLTTVGMEWLYKGLEKYSYITIRSIIFKAMALIAMFRLVREKEDYVIYGACTVVASSLSYILNFIYSRELLQEKTGKLRFRRHIKPIVIFFAMTCATTIYTNMDTLMLGIMKGNVDVGYYSTVVKVKTVLVAVVTSLGTVLLPRVSHYVEKREMKLFYGMLKKSLGFSSLISIPLAVFFIQFAEETVLILAGVEFQGAIRPMEVILPAVVLIGITNVLGIQYLVPMGKEKMVLVSEIAGAIVNLILNIKLIPIYSGTGAAIGTLCAEAAVLLVQFKYIDDCVRKAFYCIPWKSVLCAVVFSILCSLWVKEVHMGEILTLFVGGIAFFGIYALVLLLTRESSISIVLNNVMSILSKDKR